jgi:putative transposase
MRGRVSPATGRGYPLAMICAVFRVPRSSVYAAAMPRSVAALPPGKRGPKTRTSDTELVEAIRAVLAATPFHGRAIVRCGRAWPRADSPWAVSACSA